MAPDIDETPQRFELPRLYARRMALSKVLAVCRNEMAMLAADTIVVAGRRILPKAETPAEARACLAVLSGRRHRVITAVVLRLPDGNLREREVTSQVAFARLSVAQINAYIDSGEWVGKAGGYAIQGRAASFVRFLSGSYSNVVGLPLFETAQLLRSAGLLAP